MNNMRRGFTMIELIFVIVIIGILAAVAIPKLAETSKEASNSNVKSFVGTMNRTAGATMWATAMASGDGTALPCATLATYIDVPSEVTHDTADCEFVVVSPATGTIAFTTSTNAEGPTWVYTP